MPKQGYLGAFYAKVFEKLVEDCEDAWEESDPVTGVTSEIDTEDKKEGSASVRLTMLDTAEIGVLASEVVALDLTKHRRVTLWIKSSVVTEAGNLQLLLDDNPKCASPIETLDIPAITETDTWTAVTLTLATPAGLGSVISIGLNQAVDLGPCVIHLDAIKAISSLVVSVMEDTDPATGDGTNKEFQIANANIDLDTLVVQVNAVTVKDYDVTSAGLITFVTAPANLATVKCTYTYWVVVQAGGFHNWAFSLVGDTVERTDFSTTGWKKFVGILKGWTGSAERFWLNSEWMAEMGNLLIVKFYEDTGTAKERHEGWALITGIDVSAAVSTLIMEPISFQGHGKLSFESG